MIVNTKQRKNIRFHQIADHTIFWDIYSQITAAHFKWIFVWIKREKKKNLCQFGYSYIRVWLSWVSCPLVYQQIWILNPEDEESMLSWNVGHITHWHDVISQKCGILSYITAKISKLKLIHISSKLWVHICVSFLIALQHK